VAARPAHRRWGHEADHATRALPVPPSTPLIDDSPLSTSPSPVRVLLDSLHRVATRMRGDGVADPVEAQVRTATTALHLTNLGELIEQSHRLSHDGGAVGVLRGGGISGLDSVVAQPVLTAHPTEARRRAVLRRLRQARAVLETAHPGQPRADALQALDVAVEMLWRTDSVRHTTLTVADEVLAAEAFLRGPLAEAAIHVETLAQPHASAAAPARLRLGSWIGGDQDGNPHCTAADLRRALRGAEEIARTRHHAFALEAVDALTLPARAEDLDSRTRRWLRIHAGDRLGRRHRGEVLRLVAEVVAERLGADPAMTYRGRAQIAADIDTLAGELARLGAGHLVVPLLGRWRAWCRLAGFHLVDLDVRTHSSILHGLARAATREAERLWDQPGELLRALLASGPPVSDVEEHERLLDSLAVWADFLRHSPDLGGAFVLSECSGPGEMMVALWLLRSYPPCAERIRISPLFENEASLSRCGETLNAALALPEYRAHLGPARLQDLTLGYSDTTKATGYLSGALALRRAHQQVAAACEAAGVRPLVLHGRGGTVARGGGPTAEAVLAQPPRTLGGRLRWTEQGESIGLRFDDPVVGANHLAETLVALAASAAGGGDTAVLPDWVMAAADRSREVYEAWYADEGMAAFHRAFTPLDAIERLAIGSRPARRTAEASPRTLRAIPWHFSWAQTRVVASVWYGAGSGLGPLTDDPGLLARARDLYHGSTWFRSTVDNLEMVVFKTDWEVAGLYAGLAADAGAGCWLPRLREECERCREALLAIRGGGELLDHQSGLRGRLIARGEALRPLHELQVSLLARWRRAGDDAVLRLVHGTINGIAAGVQNTG
jgi:phosphoenolpyruvate carboxylase